MKFKDNQLAQLLKYLENKRDSYDLYSVKWFEYNRKYQDILFKIK